MARTRPTEPPSQSPQLRLLRGGAAINDNNGRLSRTEHDDNGRLSRTKTQLARLIVSRRLDRSARRLDCSAS